MNRFNTLQRLALVVAFAGALSTTVTPSFAGRDVGSGQTGGGNCSLWALIKSSIYGVDCRYY